MDLAARMQDPAYWHALAPGLNTNGASIGPRYEIRTRDLEFAFEDVRDLGYGQLDNALPVEDVADVLKAVTAVRAAGLLPMYAFAYDEAWAIYLRLASVWKRFLGPGWQFMPAIWVWWIEQGARNAGFPAHRDRAKQNTLRADGSPMTLTSWIPLMRALPSNGCMYVIPNGLEFDKLDLRSVQRIRALPCVPGTVMMWNQSVWHWSGNSSQRAPNPRVSMAIEMQCAPTGKIPVFQGPLIDPMTCPPPLNERLALVAKQILQYRHLTKLDGEPVALAEALLRYA